MKQYYESEVLFQLMEREGFNIPSSVPPYESEIKAYLINQVKQAYPKLTDYEAEWLLYNYTKHLPADFPIRSVSDVTEATFENVVPFAYQSAILSGQTLVNIPARTLHYVTNKNNKDWVATFEDSAHLVKPNTKYYICVFNNSNESKDYGLRLDPFTTETKITISPKGYGIFMGMTVANITSKALIVNRADHTSDNDVKILFIEYQDGMENWDIPYFEGMQSVKLPVLNSVGKNLLNPSWKKEYGKFYPFKLKKGTTLTLSTKDSVPSLGGNLLFTTVSGRDKWFPIDEGATKNTMTLDEDVYQVNYVLNGNIEYQLEIGSAATPFEPYKSNILSTSEDVVLRAVGEVRDELNLLTGEVINNVGKFIFDGTHDYGVGTSGDVTRISISNVNARPKTQPICDKLKTILYTTNNQLGDELACIHHTNDRIDIYILTSKCGATIDKIKAYLTTNPITVQYQLETESIKTVDLTTVNENGETTHFMPIEGTMSVQSSGEIIQPTFDMSVPVEATTQNLASFIDLEMEE